MNILLNAANVRTDGRINIALNLINGLVSLRAADRFFLLCPPGTDFEGIRHLGNVQLIQVPERFEKSYLSKIWHTEFVFRKLCRKHAIDKVASLGNVAIRADKKPQLLYIQNAFLVHHDSQAWKLLDWKTFLKNSLMDQWAALHLKNATCYAVQTEVMKARLIKRFELPDDKVSLIPIAADSHTHPSPYPGTGSGLHLIFLSKWYAHKNFQCLVPLAKMIREQGLPVAITLTLDAAESEDAKALLQEIKDNDLEHILPNIGSVPFTETGTVMQKYQGLFLPTLLETFSGAYAEALSSRRLIFTSHYDFAVNNLGDAAFYFDPLNTDAIFNALKEAINRPELVAQKLVLTSKLAEEMPGWPAIVEKFSALLDNC